MLTDNCKEKYTVLKCYEENAEYFLFDCDKFCITMKHYLERKERFISQELFLREYKFGKLFHFADEDEWWEYKLSMKRLRETRRRLLIVN